MNRTKIEWVVNADGSQGFTWNPVTGCLHGCGYCYARGISKRFDKVGDFRPTFHQDRLSQPFGKRSSTIFVCSMGDLFGEWVPDDWINEVLDNTRFSLQHDFIFLTKNPGRYREFYFPKNCWLGASTDTSNHASTFTNNLSSEKRQNKTFISAEPLLEDVSKSVDYDAVDWIIIGGLNRSGKPVPAEKGGTSIEWVMNLIGEADSFKIPVFVKDGLCEPYPTLRKWRELPYLGKG